MMLYSSKGAYPDDSLEVLWEDGERVFCRKWRLAEDGSRSAVLAVLLAAERPSPAALDHLAHEYELRDALDAAWAARPLAFGHEGGQTALLLEDPGGEPLERLIGAPIETGHFLRLAIGIVAALGKAHHFGLVHKDLKPHNILVNCADGGLRLTGFGIASRLPRERQAPEPPGGDRRHARLYGAGANRTDEPLDRLAQRPLRARRCVLSDAYWAPAVQRGRSHGMDPLPYRSNAYDACRDVWRAFRPQISKIVMKLLAKTAEDRYQTAAGVEHDLGVVLPNGSALGASRLLRSANATGPIGS